MRLIDADVAIELLRSLGNRCYRRKEGTIDDAMKMLMHSAYTPTIDAVPVVRCKDCKNYKMNPYSVEGDTWCMCWADWLPTEPDDFCSYGERRDNV